MPTVEHPYWKRTYRFGGLDYNTGKGFIIGQENTKGFAPHIQFSVEKSDYIANTGQIILWNLTKDQENILSSTGAEVYLEAGYGDNRALITKGMVKKVKTELDGADYRTEINIVDSLSNFNDSYKTLSFQKAVSVYEVLGTIKSMFGIQSISITDMAKERTQLAKFSGGYSVIGTIKDIVKDCCNMSYTTYKIENGILQIFVSGESIMKEYPVVSAKTGLIRIPKKIFSDAITSNTYDTNAISSAQYGWEVETILNGAITKDSKIILDCDRDSGEFLVYKVQFQGDNYSGNWTTKMEIVKTGLEIDNQKILDKLKKKGK